LKQDLKAKELMIE